MRSRLSNWKKLTLPLFELGLQAAQFIALAQLLGACCQRHLAFTHPFVQAVGAYAQAVGELARY